MNTIIIDDEPRAIETLAYYLTEFFDEFKIVETHTTIEEGLKSILKNNIDVIFLDINMPNGSGIELLEQISCKNIATVFVTAHSEYAIEAIKLDAFDYLLKPIAINELNRVYLKLKNRIQPLKCRNKIDLKISSNHYLFEINEIIHISSEGNYSTVYSTNQKDLIISRNLKKLEEEFFTDLPFIRVHQSYIININHVKSYSSNELTLTSNVKVPISVKRYKEFSEKMSTRD